MSASIGKISGSHGVKGEVILEHQLQGKLNTTSWDALLIELLPNSRIPFFIERIKEQTATSLLVKFEEIHSPEEAVEILQRNVFLSPNVATTSLEIKTSVHTYIGYTLFDKEHRIGQIDNILNPDTNPLFIIHEGTENELLIPANEELILEKNEAERTIRLEVPEGLI